MKAKSEWLKGFLAAEGEVKSGVTRVSVELDNVTFHYPEGGSSGYGTNDQYLRGMKDYVKQYEEVIKEVLSK